MLLLINDNSPESVSVGARYSSRSALPSANICHIATTVEGKTSRSAFETGILGPLAHHLKSYNLQDQILYIVTTPGLPLTIDGDSGPAGDLCSVDSALALTYRYMLTGSWPHGRVENPYFAGRFNKADPHLFRRRDYDIYLVTRLPRSSQAEDQPPPDSLGGFYFDLSSTGPSSVTDWSNQAVKALRAGGLKASLDRTGGTFDDLTGVQGYASEECHCPPIRWNPGALVLVFDKGCAADPYMDSGAAGFGGFVEDPLSDGYIRPQILFPAWAAGFNMAEAFYSASRYLNWRQVVVGDPLAAVTRGEHRAVPADAAQAGLDPDTGLPEHFARRKLAYLVRRFSTNRQAAALLARAEAAVEKGESAAALALLDKSLQLDPSLKEARRLKSELQPRPMKAVEIETRRNNPSDPAEPVPEPLASPSAEYPPRVLFSPEIEYPLDAWRAKIDGVVVVTFTVDELGQVMKADVVSGNKSLAKSVLKSARKWRFEPKLENGRPVVSRCDVLITFKADRK